MKPEQNQNIAHPVGHQIGQFKSLSVLMAALKVELLRRPKKENSMATITATCVCKFLRNSILNVNLVSETFGKGIHTSTTGKYNICFTQMC